jgi:hypothetical protein
MDRVVIAKRVTESGLPLRVAALLGLGLALRVVLPEALSSLVAMAEREWTARGGEPKPSQGRAMDLEFRLPRLALRRRRFRAGGWIAASLVLGLVMFPEVLLPFVAINLTPSLPRGLYRITRLRVRPGALVTFCVPREIVERPDVGQWIAPGRCPGGKAPLSKRIVAVGPGRARCEDTVFEVRRGEVFVRGDSARSIDSCIFGPVQVAWLRDGVVPLWTF